MRPVFRVGLTGNVASGKSAVAGVWERVGAAVIDADVLARRAVEPGTPGLALVREAFGDEVLADGGMDRAAVRRLVFADPGARERLEAIIHPEVGRLRAAEEEAHRRRGAEIVVHDIPLLFEVGLEHEFDMLVLVDAPREVRAERLARYRALEPDEIRALMASQMAASAKRGRVDVVIENDGALAELEREAMRVWREVLRRSGAGNHAGIGRVRVDMHIHTRRSHDSLNDPEAVIERALVAGLDHLCITDHDEIEAALELADRYPGRVIPGEEVRTAEGVDVIGLFLREWIPPKTPARETCERIREQGGLVYVPHPFAPGKGGRGRVLPEIEELVHVVEGFNARIHDPTLNDRARTWARDRGLPLGAGSDAHTLREIGRAYVELPAFDDAPEAFLAALPRASIHGRASSRFVHFASALARLVP